MKKLLRYAAALAFLLTTGINVYGADPVKFTLGDLTVNLPLQDVEAVYLYDLVAERGLAGVQTPLASFGDVNGTIGAVSDTEGHGAPFLSANLKASEKQFSLPFTIGVWAGYDFTQREKMGGISASIQLW